MVRRASRADTALPDRWTCRTDAPAGRVRPLRRGRLILVSGVFGLSDFERCAHSLRCRNIFVDVDAVALESGEQVVGREDVVHFVIEQLTAFLTEVDEVADLAGFS